MGFLGLFRIENLWADQFQNEGVLGDVPPQLSFLGINRLICHKAKIKGLWGITGIHLKAMVVVVVLQNKERDQMGSIQG